MTTTLTSGILTQLGCTAANATKYVDDLNTAMAKYEINTELRVAAFIAQCLYESAYLSATVENLNYSASGLLSTFPKYFDSTTAAQYARQPQKIANHVYANRYGNGNEASGDGWTYRGRGFFQITFRTNYHSCSRGIGLDCLSTPDLLTANASTSAAWFWNSKGLNAYADRKLFDKTTLIINGGTNGAAARLTLYNTALQILTGQVAANVDPTNTDDITAEATPLANKQNFAEPVSPAVPVYPYNQVMQTRSGHLVEYDDTPGAERIHTYHKSGTYWEMQPNGTFVLKAALDMYTLAQGDYYLYSKGDFTAKMGGQCFTQCEGNWIIKGDAEGYIDVAQRLQINTPLLAVSQNLTSPNGTIDQLVGTYGDILVREANLAHDIGSTDGSGGGPILNDSLQFDGGGNPQFIKPVSVTQPITLGSDDIGSLPTPSSYPNSIHTATNPNNLDTFGNPTKSLIYSDGTNWYTITGTPIVNNTNTGSNGG